MLFRFESKPATFHKTCTTQSKSRGSSVSDNNSKHATGNWQLVKSIFSQVVDLPAAEQTKKLNALTSNQSIIDEVSSLIFGEKNTLNESGLNTLITANAHELFIAANQLKNGAEIGAFTIEKLIGQGGMGNVYLARRTDNQFEQLVAVKVSHFATDNSALSSRFILERQLLGRLIHPNIGRIYDSGETELGFPYIVMEYIEGLDIVRYCNVNRLTIEQRIELFGDVLEAIEFAHIKGIIHRDIKPGNVLVSEVDGKAIPKIIDFGIAHTNFKMANQKTEKQTQVDYDATLDLVSGIGTPNYMSPEQIEEMEEADHRCDDYSLGILLYQLLVGELPYKIEVGSSTAELLACKNQKPLSLIQSFQQSKNIPDLAYDRSQPRAQLLKCFQSDLNAIVIKSFSADPNCRYGSTVDFLRDLNRYRSHFPVKALPISRNYWFRMLVRRNRSLFVFSGLLIIAVVGSFVLVSNAYLDEQQAHELAEVEMRKSTAISDYLADLFSAVDPREKGRQVKVIDILDKAEAEVKEKFEHQPLILASLYTTFGRSRTGLDDIDRAVELLSYALEIRTSQLGESHLETLTTGNLLAEVSASKKTPTQSVTIFESLLEKARSSLGKQHALTMTLINNVAVNSYYVGMDNDDQQARQKALLMMEELLAIRSQVLGELHRDTSHARNNLAFMYASFDKHTDALKLFQDNLQIQLKIYGKDNYFTLATMSNISGEFLILKNYPKAVQFAKDSYEGLKIIQGIEHNRTLRSAKGYLSALIQSDQDHHARQLVLELKPYIGKEPLGLTVFTEQELQFIESVTLKPKE